MSEFKIEKGIPIPETGSSLASAFRKMEPGDSVFVEGRTPNSISSVCAQIGGKGAFSMRKEGNGYRVWRIK